MKTGPLPPGGPEKIQVGRRYAISVDPTEAGLPKEKHRRLEKKEGSSGTVSVSIQSFSPTKILGSLRIPADFSAVRIVQFLKILHLPFKKEIIQSLRTTLIPYPIEQREGAAWLHTLALAKGIHLSPAFVSRALSELFPTIPAYYYKEEQGDNLSFKTSPSPFHSQKTVGPLDPDGGHGHEGAFSFSQKDEQPFTGEESPQSEEKNEEDPFPDMIVQRVEAVSRTFLQTPYDPLLLDEGAREIPSFLTSLPFWDFFTRLPSKTGREWLIFPLTPEEGITGTLRFLFNTLFDTPPFLQSFTVDVMDKTRSRFVFVFNRGSLNQWQTLVMSSPSLSDTKGIQAILAPFTQEVTYKPIPQKEDLFPELEDLLEL
ncbi:MAG: hypothetical protein N2Z76_06790 [Treponemataceae bacterium]|nr:hypothetical protein [Treponemataceae bacterium]